MNIIWSEEAKQDYLENIEYLLEKWTKKSAVNFINEVDAVLELLKINPELFPLSDYQSIRRAVIMKQITLYYQLKGPNIYLIRFWNSYQNPDSLKV